MRGESIRAFRMFDVEARGVDPTAFRQKSSNGCWPAAPPAPARTPPPPDCERVRCTATATTDDGLCGQHAREEAEWHAAPAAPRRTGRRRATMIHPRLHGIPTNRG